MEKIIQRAKDRMIGRDLTNLRNLLRNANDGSVRDVFDQHALYYQFLPCLIDEIKPMQIVELGGAMGASALCMLDAKYQDFDLYTMTLQEHGLEYSYIVDDFKQLHMSIGDDLDIDNWPSKLHFKKTDLWFFDAEHTKEHLQEELLTYSPFFKSGAIILFDDVKNFGMYPVWQDLKEGRYGNLECIESDWLHTQTSFGICQVK